MKKRIFAFLLAAGLFGTGAASGAAQAQDKEETSRKGRRGVALEFWGGRAHLSPNDLNLRSDYDNAYVDVFPQDYNFLARWRSGSYSYIQTAASTTEFPSLSGAYPLGFRAKIGLSRIWSVSLGLAFLSRSVTTFHTDAYLITDLDPDNVEFNASYEQQIDFPRWRLAVRAWTPMAAVHARTRLGRRITLEGFAGAGILFAHCASTRELALKTIDSDGFWELNSYLEEMRGDGKGVSLEVGAQLGLPLNSQTSAFIEGSYAYRVAAKITGSYSYRRHHEDANSESYDTQSAWEGGVWRVAHATFNNYGGQWNASWPTMRDPAQTAGSDPFHLNLSGFQVKIGIAWHI